MQIYYLEDSTAEWISINEEFVFVAQSLVMARMRCEVCNISVIFLILCMFVCLFIYSFIIYLFIYYFICHFIYYFIYYFICLFIHLSIYLFIYLFSYPLIYLILTHLLLMSFHMIFFLPFPTLFYFKLRSFYKKLLSYLPILTVTCALHSFFLFFPFLFTPYTRTPHRGAWPALRYWASPKAIEISKTLPGYHKKCK